MEMQNSMGMLAGMGIGYMILAIIVGILVGAAILLLSMKIVGVEGRSYLKSIGVVVAAFVVNMIIGFLLGMVLGAGMLSFIINLVISLLVTGWFVSLFCKSSFGKGVGAAALYWVFTIILGVIIFFIMMALGMAAG